MEGEHRGAFLSRSLRHGLLGQGDTGEHDVERQALIAENHTYGVKAFVEAVKELGGEVNLGDGVLDVGKAIGKELHGTCVLLDREIALLEVAILPVEDHEPGSTVGEEVITDLGPDGKRGGGADDMIHHGVRESGVDPQGNMSIKLEVGGISVGRRGMLDEMSDAVENKDHEEEGLPLMIIVVSRV